MIKIPFLFFPRSSSGWLGWHTVLPRGSWITCAACRLKPLNLASALLIRLRHHPPRSQLHSAGHEDSLLPGCRLPVLSLHHKGRSMTKRVGVSAFAGATRGSTLQLSVISSSWTS